MAEEKLEDEGALHSPPRARQASEPSAAGFSRVFPDQRQRRRRRAARRPPWSLRSLRVVAVPSVGVLRQRQRRCPTSESASTSLLTPDPLPRFSVKILLVEDTELNRVLVRRMAKGMNVGLEEAENGQVALDFIARDGRSYDLILMDKEMPVMDGHEATRRLRSIGVRTPIVALSGNGLASDRDLFIRAGADEFLVKPLSKDALAGMVRRYGVATGEEDQAVFPSTRFGVLC